MNPQGNSQTVWSRISWAGTYSFAREVVDAFVEKKVMRLAASLAFYSLFSLAPLFILLVVAISFLWGSQPSDTQFRLLQEVEAAVGGDVAAMLATMLDQVDRPDASSNVWSGLLGILLTAVGATVVFGQLQTALNDLWEVRPKPEYGIRGVLFPRVISLGIILLTGLLMVLAFALNVLIYAVARPFQALFPATYVWLEILNYGMGFGLMAVILAALYRFLPDVSMSWRVTWLGAALTSLLFGVGREAIGWYLGTTAVRSAYGAAGSLVVLLFWIYYSSTLLLLGAVITYVTSRRMGFAIIPAPHAEVFRLFTESSLREPAVPEVRLVPVSLPSSRSGRSLWKSTALFLAGWWLGRRRTSR